MPNMIIKKFFFTGHALGIYTTTKLDDALKIVQNYLKNNSSDGPKPVKRPRNENNDDAVPAKKRTCRSCSNSTPTWTFLFRR